jgi:hypothetical protein
MKRLIPLLFFVLLALVGGAAAQDATATPEPTAEPIVLPNAYRMEGFSYIAQTWNNCGPATLVMGLSYFGATTTQAEAAAWLKPNTEDKNVSADQMVQYVNDFVPGVAALWRYGGEFDQIRNLMLNGFPVIIEMGYDPEPDRLGWMGHYLLLVAWDDSSQTVWSYDSYDGQDFPYSYADVENYWSHFNHRYIVLFEPQREAELLALLGTDADPNQNLLNTLEEVRGRLMQNPENAFDWFNMGTIFTELGGDYYSYAAEAYDEARRIGLPWRMNWYQFGMFEAYIAVERYGDAIALAQANLNDGGGQYVEETYYYAGVAREGLGEIDRARANYQEALNFNPNFIPAREALDRLSN